MNNVLGLIGFVILLTVSATVCSAAIDREDEAERHKSLLYQLGLLEIDFDEDVDDELFIAQLKLKFDQSLAQASNAATKFERRYLTNGESYE